MRLAPALLGLAVACQGAPRAGLPLDAAARPDAAASPDAPAPPPLDPREPGPLLPARQARRTVPGGAPGRALEVEVTLPREGGPFPVVVWSHATALDLTQYRSYAEQLASRGFAVVAWNVPPGSGDHETLAADLVALVDWAAAEDGLDPGRVGTSGHGLGGKLSLLAAQRSPRVRAAFTLDPVDAGAPSALPGLPGLAIPTGVAGQTTNADGPCAPQFQAYFDAARAPAVLVELIGADHWDFLDDPECGLVCAVCTQGEADPAIVRRLARGYLTAFYEVHLRGDTRYAAHFMVDPALSEIVRIQTK